MGDIYHHKARLIDGREVALDEWRGQVLLIVNTASKCGFTPQYRGLETLYENLRHKGFAVLAFPCNQFGKQEPEDDATIAQFCADTFNVSFPLFAKVDVNGPDAHPLFGQLKEEAPGLLGSQAIKWNFTKFLVNRAGQPVERFAPTVKPEDLASRIIKLF